MRKRTRRILFWSAVCIFGLVSWIAVRYAQGYAYDFSAGHFVQTGAIAITTDTSATLLVNDREVGSTSFLSGRVVTDGLVPGDYDIRVTRDGFSSWRKTANVQEGLLTDFPHVLILPTDIQSKTGLKFEASISLSEALTLRNATPTPTNPPASRPPRRTPPGTPEVQRGEILLKGTQLLNTTTASASVIAENVLGFSVSDNGSSVLWWSRNEVWIEWLHATEYQPFRTEGERQAVTRFSVPIQRAAWYRGNDHVVVDLGGSSYRIIETDQRGGTNIIAI